MTNNKIVQLRQGLGLTQYQLAKKAGLPQIQISRWETEVRKVENMTLKNAVKVAAALGVHAEDLL